MNSVARRGRRSVEEMQEKKTAFLKAVETSFGVMEALHAVGVRAHNTFDNWKKDDAEFAAKFKAARERAIDRAEAILYQTSVGEYKMQNQQQFLSMAMFLNANRPEKYNTKASYELVHTTKKEKALEQFQCFTEKLIEKEDGKESTPGTHIQPVGLLPDPRTTENPR